MARGNHRRTTKRRSLFVAVAVLCVAGIGIVTAGATWKSHDATPTTTTTTTPPRELPQSGWTVVSSSGRGVMVDTQLETIGTATFRVLRMRARTTLLRWHDGSQDPPMPATLPADARSSVDWANEGPAGVVAVFNGAFKKAANAGGAFADGVSLEPLVVGDATIALSNEGHWAIGTWGSANFPPAGFSMIAARQNLSLLVDGGHTAASATANQWVKWGDPLKSNPLTARTGVGVDANGNLIYVGTESGVLPMTLAAAMERVGIVTGMELDMNPFWPMAGATFSPLHSAGAYVTQIVHGDRTAATYNTGWERDFFVALAEPNSWTCSWSSSGLTSLHTAQAQPLHLVGQGCSTSNSKKKG